MESLEFIIPVQTVSEMNKREHWSKRYKRLKNHKQEAFIQTKAILNQVKFEPIGKEKYALTLTRVGKRFLDYDNLASSFKGVIDGICLALSIDDSKVEMKFMQEKAVKNCYVNVRIEFNNQ